LNPPPTEACSSAAHSPETTWCSIYDGIEGGPRFGNGLVAFSDAIPLRSCKRQRDRDVLEPARRFPVTTEAARPRNMGEQYPADPPTVEEIVAVMRTVGDRSDGHRLRALIVLRWRAGLRMSEARAFQESDLARAHHSGSPPAVLDSH
jgi:hypothetical protein